MDILKDGHPCAAVKEAINDTAISVILDYL